MTIMLDPPTRNSTSAVGVVKGVGANHRLSSAGSVQQRKTAFGEASIRRFKISSWVAFDIRISFRVRAAASHLSLPREPSPLHCQNASRAVHGGKEKACRECEMIDEESELGLVSGPMRRPVERKAKEQHISRGDERGFGKIRTGEETRDQSEFQQCGEPGQKRRQREARRRDVGGRRVDIDQLETHRHDEHQCKNQTSCEDRRRRPSGPLYSCCHGSPLTPLLTCLIVGGYRSIAWFFHCERERPKDAGGMLVPTSPLKIFSVCGVALQSSGYEVLANRHGGARRGRQARHRQRRGTQADAAGGEIDRVFGQR